MLIFIIKYINKLFCLVVSHLFIHLFSGAGDQTQDPAYIRQMFCHPATPKPPPCHFLKRLSHSIGYLQLLKKFSIWKNKLGTLHGFCPNSLSLACTHTNSFYNTLSTTVLYYFDHVSLPPNEKSMLIACYRSATLCYGCVYQEMHM